MIIRKCDSCGKEINVFIAVQTAINVTGPYEYANVSNMLHLKRNFELCKDCAEEMFEFVITKKPPMPGPEWMQKEGEKR